MSFYDFNVKRFGLLLLPVFMRRPIMAAFVRALMQGVAMVHGDFMRWRLERDDALRRTGQVCSLRGLLNDMFDDEYRGIDVSDTGMGNGAGLVIKARALEYWIFVPARPGDMITECRGYGGSGREDFEIRLPMRLRGKLDMARMAGVVNKYKLCSRRWTANFYDMKEWIK